MYLLAKLEALWSEVDVHILKEVCLKDFRLPKTLKDTLKDTTNLNDAFDLLSSSSPFFNWLEFTILKRMAKVAGVPEAVELVNTFEKCVHSKKCSEVKSYPDNQSFNPDYLTPISAKLNKNKKDLIVADLIKYCRKVESILHLPNNTNMLIDHRNGCLEMYFVMPTMYCYYAYEIAKNNFFRFRFINIQYIQIGNFSRCYTVNLTNKENAKCHLEKITSISDCKF